MERKIMHADINHCFAQILEMLEPSLKDIPMAVGGDESKRHGIILARNLKAKAYGVKTGESLREAKAKCPNLLINPPNYQIFQYYAKKVKDIYREYSDKVESFGIDEAWVDLTHSQKLFGPAEKIVKVIQRRVLEELGLTISIGLSFNKVFAKLGSDFIKPSGLVVINKENFKEIVWPCAVSDLIMVGSKTEKTLNKQGIYTIGDIVRYGRENMMRKFGKHGDVLWVFASGQENNQVNAIDFMDEIKSIGNSITTFKDITNYEEGMIVFEVLAESVASRLKEHKLEGNVVAITIRDVKLKSFSRQKKMENHTNLLSEILNMVRTLFYSNYTFDKPIRSVGVSMTGLREEFGYRQTNFLVDESKRLEQYKLEKTVDELRRKYGYKSIGRLSSHLDLEMTDFNPKDEHVVFPVSWF